MALDWIDTWLKTLGLRDKDEIDQNRAVDEDLTWVLKDGGTRTLVQGALEERGLPRRGALADYWSQRLSGRDMPDLVYKLYHSQGGQGGNEQDVARFWRDYVSGVFDSSIGDRLGFAPARTYGQALALLNEAVNPDTDRAIFELVEEAYLTGDDAQMLNVVSGIIGAVGATVFNRIDMQLIESRLNRIWEDFQHLKYNRRAIPIDMNFLEFLAQEGAFYLGRLLPGVDWSALARLEQRIKEQEEKYGGSDQKEPELIPGPTDDPTKVVRPPANPPQPTPPLNVRPQ